MAKSTNLEKFAQQGSLVVMAGAGVSAGKPSSLPGWKDLNAEIVNVLQHRLETALHRPGWLDNVVASLRNRRSADRFPPDYQAQIIEEMCGDRYFRALQSLDVDTFNKGHDGIATLAQSGAVKAIVTTNFDRLTEHALDHHGVSYEVAYDDLGFEKMRKHLDAGVRKPIPVIKIHGSVDAHLSMIDTLKQRKRSRSREIEACLAALDPVYWLFLGFSGADLEGDPEYLGLLARARNSYGATYVAFPKSPGLGTGAQLLMSAFKKQGSVVVNYIDEQLAQLCDALGTSGPVTITAEDDLGFLKFQEKLQAWAEGLSVAAAGLCLAAIFEASSEAEAAVQILDRLVRKALYDERSTADFRALQLQYGRLGGAWGRVVNVPDLYKNVSNISVETMQSLVRLKDTELAFATASWLNCTYLWLGLGDQATFWARQIMIAFVSEGWRKGSEPRTDEEAVDAWLSAAQVLLINSSETTHRTVAYTADTAFARAQRSGDVVRGARVMALKLLAFAPTTENLPSMVNDLQMEFKEAKRVNDGFSLGMRSLALGSWYNGPGGFSLTKGLGTEGVAYRAIFFLSEAMRFFQEQVMDPWYFLTSIHIARAYFNFQEFSESKIYIDRAVENITRFPILTTYIFELHSDISNNYNDLLRAAETAEECGLFYRSEQLRQILPKHSERDT